MSFSFFETMFNGEVVSVLIIILTLIILAAALYTSTLHSIKQQQAFLAQFSKPTPTPPAPATTTATAAPVNPAAAAPPLSLTPEQQFQEREEYMNSVQNSLEKRFHDVDIYFATKQLIENRQLQAQQTAERQRHYARQDFLDWSRELQAIRTMPMPRVMQPPAPPMAQQIPFIPQPGFWDPMAEQQIFPVPGEGCYDPTHPCQGEGHPRQGYMGGYQMGWTGEASGYAPRSMVAPMVDRWLDGVSDDTHLSQGSFAHGTQRRPNSASNSDNGSTISVNSRMTHISI